MILSFLAHLSALKHQERRKERERLQIEIVPTKGTVARHLHKLQEAREVLRRGVKRRCFLSLGSDVL